MIYFQIILILIAPLLFSKLQQKWPWMKSIVLAYLIGVLVGNIWPQFFMSEVLKEATGISIILAIPLMLFPSRVKEWISQPKTLLLSYGLAIIATTISVFLGWFLFKESLPDIPIISGMVEGVYTGGTVNLNAIGLAFEAPNSLSVLLNSYDMAFSAIYLLAIFSFLPKILGWVLKKPDKNYYDNSVVDSDTFKDSNQKQKLLSLAKGFGIAILVLLITIGISFILTGEMNELVMVFGVSLLALLVSFIPNVRKLKGNMVSADYLMMIFGFCLGAQANVRDLMSEQGGLMNYFLFTYLCMLIIHLLLARIMKIDVDTFLVSSTAAVFGPPFIGPVAESLKNRSLIGPGIVVALMGNAIGTYLGIIMVQILSS
ncbi:MAG: DUF819 family protein [Salibacteraceae bacterium]